MTEKIGDKVKLCSLALFSCICQALTQVFGGFQIGVLLSRPVSKLYSDTISRKLRLIMNCD